MKIVSLCDFLPPLSYNTAANGNVRSKRGEEFTATAAKFAHSTCESVLGEKHHINISSKLFCAISYYYNLRKMASKAVKVSVDWSKLASRMSATDVAKLNKLKAQFDATAVKVASLPESLPAIDWSYYKANAVNPKLVEEIEKRYSTIKVDKPKAASKRLEDLQQAQAQDEERYKRFCEFAKSFTEAAEVVKKRFEDMIPVKDMSMEDYCATFPHWNIADRENPSIWPHFERAPGLTREEAAAFGQPDPLPYATKTAWKDWESKYKRFYE